MYHQKQTMESNVPVQLQKELLNNDDPTVRQFARVLYILASKGIYYPTIFTKSELKELLKPYSIGRKYIDNRLPKATIEHKGEQLPLIHKLDPSEWEIQGDKIVLTPKFPKDIIYTEVLIWKKGGNKGRPPHLYTIYPYWMYWRWLELSDQYSRPDFVDIPDQALKSMLTYRRALHAAFIETNPGQHSRRRLAKQTGVSKRTTQNYDTALGTDVELNFEIEILFDKDDFDNYAKKTPWGMLLDDEGKRYALNIKNFDLIRSKGQVVRAKCRTSNSYYPPNTDDEE
jgi:hypothetical protein